MISAVCVLVAIIVLEMLGSTWYERGLYVDAAGTSGYTTPVEKALFIGAVIAIPTLGVVSVVSFGSWVARRRKVESPSGA
ncbi:hypothetical protein ASE14_01055 [Agromyces sp. Root81]|nr:hypothetical protein ASE14_01055 [Agromyces sp. Root81]